MPDERTCSTCRHFQPRYFGIGICDRAGRTNARMWVTDNKDFYVASVFCCCEHEPPKPVNEESL